MSMMIDLDRAKYPTETIRAEFMERILEQIKNLPGVESAALTLVVPTSGPGLAVFALDIEGAEKFGMDSKTVRTFSNVNPVSPDYLRTMGMPVIRGRDFTNQDRDGSPKVAIVSRKFVRTYLQGQDPVGKHIRINDDKDWMTIIAVVGDVYNYDFTSEIDTQIYVPHMQYRTGSTLSIPWGLAVRCSGDPMALAASARGILKKMDPDQAFYKMMPLEEQLTLLHNRRKANLVLIGVSSVFALALAFIGIYGVVSYNVSRRTQEIGIRMALGAQPRNIIHLIVKQSMMSVFAGLLLGLAGAFALTRYMTSLLFGVTATDPAVFAAIPVLVVVVALIASFFPSRRATRIESAFALRNE